MALKLAGAGGDGAQTAALPIARAAINEGFDATHIPSYSPESRGGTSYADVHVAEQLFRWRHLFVQPRPPRLDPNRADPARRRPESGRRDAIV